MFSRLLLSASDVGLRHEAEHPQSASASASASASSSSDSSSSSFSSLFAEFGLPDHVDLDSVRVEKLIQMASSMLQSASNDAANEHDAVPALPKYRAPPADVDGAKSSFLPDEIGGGSSSSALASMLSVASSSSPSSSPLSALLAGAPPASSTAPPATRIVLGARPLSTTIARLERRDLLQLLLRCIRRE